MSLFSRLFKKPNQECPRCLGKGNVDWEDIKRLKKELKWLPAKCAYCNGIGKIHSTPASKSLVDNTYLTIERSSSERKELLKSEEDALHRSKLYDEFLDEMIMEIEHRYFVDRMSIEEIVEELSKPTDDLRIFTIDEKALREYVVKVTDFKSKLR